MFSKCLTDETKQKARYAQKKNAFVNEKHGMPRITESKGCILGIKRFKMKYRTFIF